MENLSLVAAKDKYRELALRLALATSAGNGAALALTLPPMLENEMPLFLAALVVVTASCFGIGFFLGGLAYVVELISLKNDIRACERELANKDQASNGTSLQRHLTSAVWIARLTLLSAMMMAAGVHATIIWAIIEVWP